MTRTPMSGQALVDYFKENTPKTWENYVQHPFVRGLAEGTVSTEQYRDYRLQSCKYLEHYAKAQSAAALRSSDLESISYFASNAVKACHAAQRHVDEFLSEGMTEESIKSTQMSEATQDYKLFLQSTYKSESNGPLEIMVSMLPCLLGYAETATWIVNLPKPSISSRPVQTMNPKIKDNPYWSFFEFFASEEYQSEVPAAIKMLDVLYTSNLSETRDIYLELWKNATNLEIAFFDQFRAGHV